MAKIPFDIKYRPQIESGEYNITVTYMGNDEYLSSINNTESFTVSKLQPVFTVTGTNITYGEPEFIEILTDSNITGKVMLEINGKNYSTFINEGRGNLTIMGLDAGKYNITAYFDGNNKYLNATAKNNFTISKAKPFIKVVPQNITFGDKEVITVKVKSWKDFDDGDQIQIKAEDGTVYLVHSSNITLICEDDD